MTPTTAVPRRARTQRSLQLLLALLLGGVVGCVTIALVLVFVMREDRDVRERVAQETSSTAASTAALLQTQFEQQLHALAMVASASDLAADLVAGRHAEINARLEAAAPAYPDFSRLAVVDATGQVVANSATDKAALGRSLADQPYVRTALTEGRASIGWPRRAIGGASVADSTAVLPLGVPIVGRDGRTIGVLQATTQLDHLNADLATIKVGRTGFVSITTPDGLLVAHPDGERLLAPADVEGADLVEASSPLAQVQQLLAPGRPLWFASTATMPSTGWVVRAQMPVAEAFESLWWRVLTAGLVVVSTSVLAVGLGVAVARRITAPLGQLVEVVERVGTGTDVDGLPETRVREVAQLATAFGVMHQRLVERTARLEAARAAAELAETQFRALIEAAPDAVIIRSESGALLFANRQAQALYGATEAELASRPYGSGVPERTRAFHQELQQYLLAHPGEVRIASGPDICVVRPDGTETPIEISATCALTPAGPRRISILRDISERYAVDRLKERFVSIVSHELRTPLTPILGLAELLLATPLNARQAEMVETIGRSSQNLLAIVNDLLDASRIQAGQLEIESTELDPRAVVADTVNLLRTRASEKRLTLAGHVAEAVPARLQGDPIRLRQVLDNLVSNAIKFTHTGEVTVQATLAEDAPERALVRFEVTDTGIGVDEDAATRLFEPFVQASIATTREYGGTGLGLAICKDLVGLMGGEIGVERAPGGGSTFWFAVRLEKAAAERLSDDTTVDPAPAPVEAAVTRAPAPLTTASIPRDRALILVVEDSPMNQLTMIGWLEHLGYRAHAVENGLLAVEAVATGAYAAVLMDCQMPVMDGYAATAQIRAWEDGRSRLPIVAMTASVQVADRERCLAAGMDDYLTKPVDPTALARTLDRWIESEADTTRIAVPVSDEAATAPINLLDVERLGSLAAIRTTDGETLVDRMIGYFVESAPAHVESIRAATAGGDLAGLTRAAHKLTGESATVGSVVVGRLAREIEHLADAGTAPDEVVHVTGLDRAVTDAIAALRQYQATVAASTAA